MSREKFYTTLNCNLHKIASETTDEATKQQLLTLWKNVSTYAGAKEAISISVTPNAKLCLSSPGANTTTTNGASTNSARRYAGASLPM